MRLRALALLALFCISGSAKGFDFDLAFDETSSGVIIGSNESFSADAFDSIGPLWITDYDNDSELWDIAGDYAFVATFLEMSNSIDSFEYELDWFQFKSIAMNPPDQPFSNFSVIEEVYFDYRSEMRENNGGRNTDAWGGMYSIATRHLYIYSPNNTYELEDPVTVEGSIYFLRYLTISETGSMNPGLGYYGSVEFESNAGSTLELNFSDTSITGYKQLRNQEYAGLYYEWDGTLDSTGFEFEYEDFVGSSLVMFGENNTYVSAQLSSSSTPGTISMTSEFEYGFILEVHP